MKRSPKSFSPGNKAASAAQFSKELRFLFSFSFCLTGIPVPGGNMDFKQHAQERGLQL
jgi:hypothetical protein